MDFAKSGALAKRVVELEEVELGGLTAQQRTVVERTPCENVDGCFQK